MSLALAVIPFTSSVRVLTAVMLLMTAGASLAVPTLSSLISKESTPENYGATMGISQSFSALARAIGPMWGSALLGISFRAPFVITGALVSGVLWVGFRAKSTRDN